MNIIGNGVDIVDNTRIKNAIKNKFFVSRIFTVNEIKKSKNFHESKLLSLNIDKAKKELSWKPNLTLKEGLSKTYTWIEKQINSGSNIEKFRQSNIEK